MFTGVSTKTSNQLYKIIDQNKRFLNDGYKKASEAKRFVSNFSVKLLFFGILSALNSQNFENDEFFWKKFETN